jgi:hypothetical protein
MKLVLALALALTSCGYKLAGQADLLPRSIQTIAIPAFANVTTQYKLTDRLPLELSREFRSRTRYQIIGDPSQADAVLTGSVINVFAGVTNFDPVTNRAAAVQVSCILALTLQERATGKLLFTRPGFEVRERYEISTTAEAYFDESTPAFDRMSKDVARSIVSSILELF